MTTTIDDCETHNAHAKHRSEVTVAPAHELAAVARALFGRPLTGAVGADAATPARPLQEERLAPPAPAPDESQTAPPVPHSVAVSLVPAPSGRADRQAAAVPAPSPVPVPVAVPMPTPLAVGVPAAGIDDAPPEAELATRSTGHRTMTMLSEIGFLDD